MSISFSIKKSDLSLVQKALTKLSGTYRDRVKKEVAISALNIEAGAKQLVRVDTGRLRSSITPEFSADRLSASVGTNVKYAFEQEFGSVRQPQKGYTPFLGPAYRAEKPRFLAALKRAMRP